ncbi:MAG: SusC/RagA family TonB-linked outer membrane protein [Rhodothermales bacterium]|nr:SusC/RagA family TonB-linked outer membrane protein [Rhodothermales bacterium]MBO6779629.1 SusC/RagA family TonB-linked outer membrane protein [Rhodothermales bacterium]
MLRKLLAAAFVVVLAPSIAFGQAVITGTVTDGDGEPLIGANVVIDELVIGSATDLDGRYTFEVPAAQARGQNVALRAKFVGFSPQTRVITLNSGTQTQDFVLTFDRLRLDEVVVTGVSSATPAKKLAFTVDKLDASKVELAPAANAVQSIQGKIAGAQITQASGQPGDGVAVRLRGTTSLTGSSAPMYIVDGVILTGGLADIDALDIESIEVVKGAAASSLYGARAQNGVIQITTKRGGNIAFNQTRVTVRNEFGSNNLQFSDFKANEAHDLLIDANGNFLNQDGVKNTCDTCLASGYGPGVEIDRLSGTDTPVSFYDNPYSASGALTNNFDEFFTPGDTYTNYISVSQNSAKTNFHASFTNFQEGGILPGMDGYNRKSFRVNLDHRISDDVQLSTSTYYAGATRDVPRSSGFNPFFGLMFTNPLTSLSRRDDNGNLLVQADPLSVEENPLYVIENVDTEDRDSRILGNARLRYEPTDWLNLEGNVSYDRRDSDFLRFADRGTESIDPSNFNDGQILRSNTISEALNADLTVSLQQTFDQLTARGQFKYQAESTDFITQSITGNTLTSEGIADFSNVNGDKIVSSNERTIRLDGLYATGGIDFADKYIADVLIRRDGSSLFGAEERWQTYYRVSGAWRVSEESFYPFGDWMEEFKLRFSQGTAGGRPGFEAQYETFTLSSGQLSKGTLGNAFLKPELQTEQEFGVEMGIMNRISASLVYANAKVEDQLLVVPLPGYFGFGSQWQNAGTIESNTIEASLDFNVFSDRNKSLDIGIVYDRTNQEITEFNTNPYKTGPSSAFYYRNGETIGAMYGIHFLTDVSELAEQTLQDGSAATTGRGVPTGFQASAFQTNDDGLLVPVGIGNSYTDGFAKGLWGNRVDVDGDGDGDMLFGMPIKEVNDEGQNFQQIGDVLPDFNLGFSTNFSFKGFSAYMLWNAQVGGDIYNFTKQWAYRDGRHQDQDQLGKADGDKKPAQYYEALYDATAVNDWYIEDGTYLKLRELSVGYRVPRQRLQSWFGNSIAGLSVNLIGRNLLTFTDYSGFDPDVGEGSDATLFRFDGFEYPKYRTFTGRVEIQF